MVSVFVSTDWKDLAHWKWKKSADAPDFEDIGELQPIDGAQFSAAVRQSPMPSIVLSGDDEAISGIVKSIYDCDDEMEDCIGALRQVVAVCLPEAREEPICLFVHRGGASFIEANPRLAEKWKNLADDLKRMFVCVAITRGGSGRNVVNSDWQRPCGINQENNLVLPSSEKEVTETLGRWCAERCPEFLATFGHASSTHQVVGRTLPDAGSDVPSPCNSADTSSSDAGEMRSDDMSKLHVWIFADVNSDGGSEKRSQEWISKQRACFKTVSCKQFEVRVIPPLASGEDRLGSVRDVYHGIAGVLGAAIEEAPSTDRFVGVLDARLYCGMRKDEMSSLQTVQGLLILAFPDVLWIPVFNGGDEAAKDDIGTAMDLVAGGFNPLFDGTGVRGTLMRNHEPNSEYPYYRNDVAVTIDEERHFAELTAYTAFRFGYRAYPVSTERLARKVLGVEGKTKLPALAGARVSSTASLVVFEDGDIEFPDADDKQNEAHLLGDLRNETWPLLKNANLRVLATAAGSDERIAWKRNQENETASNERPTESTGGGPGKFKPNSTASESFQRDFENLDGGKRSVFREWLEKSLRRWFNLSAGGMGCVWAFDLVKWVAIIGVLWAILVRLPGLLFFALFLLVGLLGNVAGKCFHVLFGRNARLRRALIIRSQWRYYPKLYTNHVPRNEIRKDNGDRGGKDSDGNDRKGCWRHVRKLLTRMHAAANSPKSYWRLVQKPLGGIFGLRNQCGLPNGHRFNGQLDADSVEDIYKNALNPERYPTKSGDKVQDSRHSAYGMTLDLATDLIGRARSMKERGHGVEDAIHAAVLATCAYELLGHKTPALSIEALGLRHYCEVLAECEFHGVRANLDMGDRLIDIHNSMSQICRASDGTVRENMFASGMAAICDNLADLLRERGRFSEAAFMTRRARFMHRLLLPPFWRNCLAYPEWVIRAPWHCVVSFAAMVVAFCVYWEVEVNRSGSIPLTFAKTWEVLVCDEPDLSWPGRDKGGHAAAIQTPTTHSKADAAKIGAGDSREAKQQDSPPDKNSPEPDNGTIPENTYSLFVHTMRQIALLHLAFLGIFFWDAMRKD